MLPLSALLLLACRPESAGKPDDDDSGAGSDGADTGSLGDSATSVDWDGIGPSRVGVA